MKKNVYLICNLAVIFSLCFVLDGFADNRQDVIAMAMDRLENEGAGGLDLGWGSQEGTDAPAEKVLNRDQRIDQALTRAASGGIKTKNFCWQDVCVLPSTSQTQYSQTPSVEYASDQRPAEFQIPQRTLEIGMEWFDYKYEEEGLMELNGSMQGIYADWRQRFRQHETVQTWKDLRGVSNNFNVLMLQTRFSFGNNIDYTSNGTGTTSDEKHYVWESRVLLGYDVPLRNHTLMMPYVGFGYRYLLDDNGGGRTTTNAWTYDRESRYYYIPVGIDITRQFKNRWSLGLNLEYDFFIKGRQKSYFQDGPAGSNYDNLTNTQKKGYGYRGSIKVIKEQEKVDFVFEPFARYWHIKDSEVEFLTRNGELVPVDGMPGYYEAGLEPDNRTWEFGIRAGIRF